MGKQICRAPEQLDAGALHRALEVLEDRRQVLLALPWGLALRRDITVVEGEVRDAEPGEEIERDVGLGAGLCHRIAGHLPRALERPVVAERIEAVPDERVPVADREAQLLCHGFTEDDPVLVVGAERERIAALGALISDRRDVGKENRSWCLAPIGKSEQRGQRRIQRLEARPARP